MPTYEYRREDGTTFEVVQRFSDPPLETCPETGQKVKRLIGRGSGLIFKGSGFYLTDYVRKGAESKAENGSSTNGKDEAKSGDSKSTESPATEKPAAKTDTKNSAAE